jgi:hypothetical protein
MIAYSEALRRVEALAQNRSEEACRKLVDLWYDPQVPVGVQDRIDMIVSEWLLDPSGFDDPAKPKPGYPPIDDQRN